MKAKKPKPLHKFRLHIKKSEYGFKGYILVQLWETRLLANQAAGYTYYASGANTFFEVTPNGHRSRIITINFWYKDIRISYIGHEIYHALSEWARWHNLDNSKSKDEELLASLQGELEQQFHRYLIKKNIHNLVTY